MVKLIILDIDGVMTDGTKVYDRDHKVLSKRFFCKDFTAIKRFIASGINVIMISGDEWNRSMAEKRNIEFYCSRGKDLSLDKSLLLPILIEKYNLSLDEIAFVGDDYFDLSMFEKLKYAFCPYDSPLIIKKNSYATLTKSGGTGVVSELYDYFVENKFVEDADPEQVALLDKKEITSQEMK